MRSSGVGMSGVQPRVPPPTYGQLEPLERDITELTGMGFSREDSVMALRLKVSPSYARVSMRVCACMCVHVRV
jgi:hypothetical protein